MDFNKIKYCQKTFFKLLGQRGIIIPKKKSQAKMTKPKPLGHMTMSNTFLFNSHHVRSRHAVVFCYVLGNVFQTFI